MFCFQEAGGRGRIFGKRQGAMVLGQRQSVAEKHSECAQLVHDMMRRVAPAHSLELGRMQQTFHEERERLRVGRCRASDAVINEMMGTQACALACASACTELRFRDAAAEFEHCLRILAHGTPAVLRGVEAGTFSRDSSGACCGDATLQDTLQQVRAVQLQSAARCDAACAEVQRALQPRRFVSAYCTLPRVLALARGAPDCAADVAPTGLEGHRAFQAVLRDELVVGAMVLYARHRSARAARLADGEWVVFLARKLGVSSQGGHEQRLALLRPALSEDFRSVVSDRLNAYNRRFILQQHILHVDAAMLDLRGHIAHTKRKIDQLLQDEA